MMKHYVRLACFVGGALFGSAGIKLLTSKDAKKAYTHITAAGLRMKDSVMETVTSVQEPPTFWPPPRTSTRPGPPRKPRLRWKVRKPKNCGREPENGSFFHERRLA